MGIVGKADNFADLLYRNILAQKLASLEYSQVDYVFVQPKARDFFENMAKIIFTHKEFLGNNVKGYCVLVVLLNELKNWLNFLERVLLGADQGRGNVLI